MAAMPVTNTEDQFPDPHWQGRHAYAEIQYPPVGAEKLYGLPWLLSDNPGNVRTPAPTLGQYNDYALGQLLGLMAQELERLQTEKDVYRR